MSSAHTTWRDFHSDMHHQNLHQNQVLTVSIARRGGWSRKHRQSHDRSPNSLSRHFHSESTTRRPFELPHRRRVNGNIFAVVLTVSTLLLSRYQHTHNQHHKHRQPAFLQSYVAICCAAQSIYPKSIVDTSIPLLRASSLN